MNELNMATRTLDSRHSCTIRCQFRPGWYGRGVSKAERWCGVRQRSQHLPSWTTILRCSTASSSDVPASEQYHAFGHNTAGKTIRELAMAANVAYLSSFSKLSRRKNLSATTDIICLEAELLETSVTASAPRSVMRFR